jgi:hypothetical protein
MQEFTAILKRHSGSGKSRKEIEREVNILSDSISNAYGAAKRNSGKGWSLDKKDVHMVLTNEQIMEEEANKVKNAESAEKVEAND